MKAHAWFACYGGAAALTLIALVSVDAADDKAATERIARLFAPLRTDTASLSPDGKYLAYSEHEKGQLDLMIVNLELNKARRIEVAKDTAESMSGIKEKLPSRLTYLAWKSPTRLIFSVDGFIIWAIGADGSNPKILMAAREVRTDFAEMRRRNPAMDLMTRRAASSSGLGFLLPDMDAGVGAFSRLRWAPPSDEEAAEEGAVLASIDTADIFSSFMLGWNSDRHPRVADLLDADSEHILVEARSNLGLLDDAVTLSGAEMSATLYRVNVNTGRSRLVEEIDTASRLVPDRLGAPRLALHYFSTSRIINYYDGKRWRDLDKLAPSFASAPFAVSPENFLGHRSLPLGFDHGGQYLYFASNHGRDTYGIYGLDLQTGRRTEHAIEHPALDLADPADVLRGDLLVYDRSRKSIVGIRVPSDTWPMTAWFDHDLLAVQRVLKEGLPGKVIQILEWDEKRETFLIHFSDGDDPGAYATFQPALGKLEVRASCDPELVPESLNRATPFSFQSPAGVRLSGIITYPRSPRLNPPPVLIYFHDGPWGRDTPGFNRGAQALATMGLAVLQVNYRGSRGFGLQHLTGTKTDRDRAAVEDGLAALDFLSRQVPLNRRLVAAFGAGYGGYLALRAVQLYPERLRAAVAINAPTDLGAWINQQPELGNTEVMARPESFRAAVRRAVFGADLPALKAMSPLTHAGEVQTPVLLIHGSSSRIVPPAHSVRMSNALRRAGAPVTHIELPGAGHANWRPGTSTRAFREIEMFVNENIYNYAVKIGELEIVP
jgi:dipeptidyl aminopeptidase/acylaminoacyl peptidase